ncbi:TRAP transporter substrate-binding protein [Martelella soudanensis]|uniref:TRAP transporter substrate-binding protein n=1 Tax=unclassified Martelella TaxID=2629616 RepID=UPI0015DE51EC|nr:MULTISPECIES: TRAP transporter substrate-binding protein [unclassified Martelella]
MKTWTSGLAAIAIGVSAGMACADELSVATFVPPQHHTNVNVFEWFGDELAGRTDGELAVRIYPGGQLGAGPVQQYKRAVEGVADVVLGVAGYTPELFPKVMLTVPPGKAANSLELSDAFIENWDLFADEFDEVVFLGIGFPAGTSLAATKDLSTLDSWKGAKIVPYTAQMAPMIEALGAVPVQMPVTDVYTALSTGTIDGAIAAHNNMLPPWNWQEVTTHYIDNIPPQFQTVYFIMNKDRYQALPEDQRAAIDALKGKPFTDVASASFHNADQQALEKMKASGDLPFAFITVSDAERARMDAAVAEGMEQIFDEYEARGISNARQIYSDLHGAVDD